MDEGRKRVLAIVGGNPSGAASEHGRRFVRRTTRQSQDRCDERGCGSMGRADHAED
jgi:hypothetical protein